MAGSIAALALGEGAVLVVVALWRGGCVLALVVDTDFISLAVRDAVAGAHVALAAGLAESGQALAHAQLVGVGAARVRAGACVVVVAAAEVVTNLHKHTVIDAMDQFDIACLPWLRAREHTTHESACMSQVAEAQSLLM